MQRGMVVVRGIRTDGSYGEIDALDLDDESFRCYVLDQLSRGGILGTSAADASIAGLVAYRQRIPPGHPRTK